ncbi:MAG: hypothetical protein ACK5FV_03405 [Bacteroidota bacterium]
MKKLIFSLMATAALASCQNSGNASDAAQTAEQAPKIEVTPEMVNTAAGEAQTVINTMDQLAGEIESKLAKTPDSEGKARLLELTNLLNDVKNKQSSMLKGLQMAQAGDSTGPTQTVLEDYVKSIHNYDTDIESIKKQLGTLKGN